MANKYGSDCIDCGRDTFNIDEYYMVHNDLWEKANPKIDGMLCIGCLEKRIGRELYPSDFTFCPLNVDTFYTGSQRIMNRMGNLWGPR